MFRPRVIPVLLLRNAGLVKSTCFKDHRYLGDPINAVRIFNDHKADELVFLDILASKENRCISLDFVEKVGDEANMPFAVGGGISSLEQIRSIIKAGAEKVILNTKAVEDPQFIRQASDAFGASTISVSMDVRKKLFSREQVYSHGGKKASGLDPIAFAQLAKKNGAGELIVNSIAADGMMAGYDIDLIKRVSEAVSIPVVALGGAGNLNHVKEVIENGYASAAAAGSLFVYHGARKAVLINYPDLQDLEKLFS